MGVIFKKFQQSENPIEQRTLKSALIRRGGLVNLYWNSMATASLLDDGMNH